MALFGKQRFLVQGTAAIEIIAAGRAVADRLRLNKRRGFTPVFDRFPVRFPVRFLERRTSINA